jgi:molybdopterin-binding protein
VNCSNFLKKKIRQILKGVTGARPDLDTERGEEKEEGKSLE